MFFLGLCIFDFEGFLNINFLFQPDLLFLGADLI